MAVPAFAFAGLPRLAVPAFAFAGLPRLAVPAFAFAGLPRRFGTSPAAAFASAPAGAAPVGTGSGRASPSPAFPLRILLPVLRLPDGEDDRLFLREIIEGSAHLALGDQLQISFLDAAVAHEQLLRAEAAEIPSWR